MFKLINESSIFFLFIILNLAILNECVFFCNTKVKNKNSFKPL